MKIENGSLLKIVLVLVLNYFPKNWLYIVLRFFFKQIGGVKGSHIYEGLSKGTMISMAYVLKKSEVGEENN